VLSIFTKLSLYSVTQVLQIRELWVITLPPEADLLIWWCWMHTQRRDQMKSVCTYARGKLWKNKGVLRKIYVTWPNNVSEQDRFLENIIVGNNREGRFKPIFHKMENKGTAEVLLNQRVSWQCTPGLQISFFFHQQSSKCFCEEVKPFKVYENKQKGMNTGQMTSCKWIIVGNRYRESTEHNLKLNFYSKWLTVFKQWTENKKENKRS